MGEQTLLSGRLGPIGLAGVLQLAESEFLSGRLIVPGAKIEINQGQIVRVATDQKTTGIVGLRDAFMGANGFFEFIDAPIEATAPLGSVVVLIMDACRVADDWARLAPLRLAPTPNLDPNDLSDPVTQVIHALDGERVVSEALMLAQVSAARVTDTLLTLWTNGLLREHGPPAPERVVQPKTPAPAAPPSAQMPRSPPPGLDEYELLEEGRKHLRTRAFDEARTCFEQALRIAPDNRLIRQNLRRLKAIQDKKTQA